MIGEAFGWFVGAVAYLAGVRMFWPSLGPLGALTWPISLVLCMIMAASDRDED